MQLRNVKHGSWSIRRRFMFTISAFCMWVVWYVLHYKLNTSPADTAMTMAFTALISITASYVFGATWEDIHRIKNDAEKEGKGDA